MALYKTCPAIDFTRLPMNLELDNGGLGPWTITYAGYGSHLDMTLGFSANVLPAYTKSLLDASPSALVFTVSFDPETGKYTISAGGVFSLTFAGLGNLESPSGRAAAMLGFTSNKAGAASYTSDVQAAWYMLSGTGSPGSGIGDAKSRVTRERHPGGSTRIAVAADGRSTYGLRRKNLPTMFDWTLQFQSPQLTFLGDKIAAAPWTWEEFFEHLEGHLPFLVADPTNSKVSVHLLQEGAGDFSDDTIERAEDELDTWWHVAFRTYRLVQYTGGAAYGF